MKKRESKAASDRNAGTSVSNWRKFTKLKPTGRNLRRASRKVEKSTARHARRFILKRWDHLLLARRAVLSWLALVAVLIAVVILQTVSYGQGFTTTAPVDGGTYSEGVVGKLTNVNPLFAENEAEKTVSALVFSSLLSYDDANALHGDLASRWSTSNDGRTYTITLRDGVKWQDGQNVTANDVVFTVDMMKNPSVGSAYYDSWRTIGVKAVDLSTIEFTLPAPFAPFPHALTFGVLPQHVYKDFVPESFREKTTTADIVGSGPYKFVSYSAGGIDEQIAYLTASPGYYVRAPRITNIQVHAFTDSTALKNGFESGSVNAAAAGLRAKDASEILSQRPNAQLVQAPLYDGVYALFNNNSQILSDKTVREALRLGTNRQQIRASVAIEQNNPVALEGPLIGESTSTSQIAQPGFNMELAKKKLSQAGWKEVSHGVRVKDGQQLKLTIISPTGTDYESAVNAMVDEWKQLGVTIDLKFVDPSEIQQTYFIPRAFDIAVYQLQIGANNDVFAYWHSSQANPRGLNFANYKSVIADASIASSRTRQSEALRRAKYETFVKTWIDDVPAIALYQPFMYYVAAPGVQSIDNRPLVDTTTRFRDVSDWTVQTGTLNRTP